MSTATVERPVAARSTPWWRRPWVLPLGAVIVAFLAYTLPNYVGFDPARSLVPQSFAGHYPILLVHIGFGTVAMVTGFLQVWPWFRQRHQVAHRWAGRIYVFAGVLPAGLAALTVGFMTPFGPVAAASHVLLSVVWLGTTIAGYRTARQRRFGDHRKWMIRSFTLTASTITNRVWAPVAEAVLGPQLDTTFQGSPVALGHAIAGLSAWLGWVIPLLVVEWWLQRGNRARRRARVSSPAKS
ncbi:DUF2306 domain-containing protein [Amycolatopsis suaedae]|uniref:DUF2306 domain-containing protein n=1 Tax=Amycolatopsis suaedae TaxID=2510978 RepID=A0A4Q7JE59_9PSEU|nr:DUF2306 domain-containing protein [Amycolatopsis suaedae]RZQ65346.1 DUF2306 domain-containing protein [Amycolatopsis suaedae]